MNMVIKKATLFCSLLIFNTVVFVEAECNMKEGYEKIEVEPIKFEQKNEDIDIVKKDFGRVDIFRMYQYSYKDGVHIFYKDTIGNHFMIDSDFKSYDIQERNKAMHVNNDEMLIGEIKIFKKENNELIESVKVKEKIQDIIHLSIYPEGEYQIEFNLCINSKLKPFYRNFSLVKYNNL